MYTWRVTPDYKKSTIERAYWTKDDNTFMHEIGWRWSEFLVYTETDEPPKLEPGVDMFDCEYETEMQMTDDGCWEDYDYDDCDEETEEWLRNFFEEEGGAPYELEEQGWSNDRTEMIIDCEMTIERVEEDA